LTWLGNAINLVALLNARLHVEVPREASIHQQIIYAKFRHVCWREEEGHGGGADHGTSYFLSIVELIDSKVNINTRLCIVGGDEDTLFVFSVLGTDEPNEQIVQWLVIQEAALGRNTSDWVR